MKFKKIINIMELLFVSTILMYIGYLGEIHNNNLISLLFAFLGVFILVVGAIYLDGSKRLNGLILYILYAQLVL